MLAAAFAGILAVLGFSAAILVAIEPEGAPADIPWLLLVASLGQAAACAAALIGKRYRVAAAVSALLLTFAVLSAALSAPVATDSALALMFLAVPVLYAGFVLGSRWALGIAAVNAAGLFAAAARIVPEAGWPALLGPLFMLAAITATVVLPAAFYMRLEQAATERAAERDAASRELLAANQALVQANRARDDFLARMSHELRTPLNSILGFTGLLLQDLAGPLNDEQRRQIGMVETSGRHLLTLVDELLDLVSVESGEMPVRCSEFDAGALAESVSRALRPLAQEKSVELTFEGSAGGPMLLSDPDRVEQILVNLVSNAVTFTSEGWIRVGVHEDRGRCVFEVSDSGCGIPSDSLDSVFDDFYRVTRPGIVTEGAGVGLSVARRLARQLGGDITVESEVGRGSAFTLSLPTGL